MRTATKVKARGTVKVRPRERYGSMAKLRLVPGHRAATGDAPPAWVKNPEYGMCRTLTGHAWEQPKAMQVVRDEVVIRLSCSHCGAGRRDHVSYRSGLVTTRAYTYPDGYQFKFGGEKRPAKSVLRRSYLHLLLDR